MNPTKEFVKDLLAEVKETGNKTVGVANADIRVVCSAHNLSLVKYDPETLSVYVRIEDCERYIFNHDQLHHIHQED
jgi:hypothetical protein